MQSLSFTHHPLQLLCHLHSLVVLGLGYSPGVEQLLDLLPRISLERPLELLEALHKTIHRLLAAHHGE